MIKNLLLLFVIINLCFTSCQKDEEQNLDITITGKVTNQNNIGVGDVTIYIQRGALNSNYGPTNYNNYETVKTNSNGDYQYLVKNDSYSYKLCC
ncbi:carboxypeptidase-like regulatory domain-containing protein [Flavobacterium sp. GSP14]|uniref:carboxypeptidase-like regulatory domain-containing protein n=1 Tax=Flavobacterium sp. GSP14 TaxID=3401734 RepID=UPI003AADF114